MDFMNWNVQELHLWILSGSRLTLVYLIHMLVQLLYFLYFIHMSSYIKALPLPFICEAQTRHLWGAAPAYDAWGTPLPARSATSCHVDFFFKADSHQRSSDSGRFALNWADSSLNRPKPLKQPIQAEIQKKKKSAKRTVWTKS